MFPSLNTVQHSAGQVVFGHYEIVSLLGVGSCGYVYLAKHKGLSDFLVALKIFYPGVENKIDIKRLKAEIRASYAVNHPNVIRCFEYVSGANLAGFTMEYAAGGSLRKLMQNGHVHDLNKIASILSSACEGLSAVHEAGIIHRDLKPENILFSSSGSLKIADFSVAVWQDPLREESGSPVGTVDYMSPEYLTSGKIDQRSDIYAVGAIIYQILTGDIPCQGANPYHTLRLRMESEPTPLFYYRPDCPLQLEDIVTKALERDPNNRYQNVKEMLVDVNEFKNIITRKTFVKKIQDYPKEETPENTVLPENTKAGVFGYLALSSIIALSVILIGLICSF